MTPRGTETRDYVLNLCVLDRLSSFVYISNSSIHKLVKLEQFPVRKFTGTDRNRPNYRSGLLFLLPINF